MPQNVMQASRPSNACPSNAKLQVMIANFFMPSARLYSQRALWTIHMQSVRNPEVELSRLLSSVKLRRTIENAGDLALPT